MAMPPYGCLADITWHGPLSLWWHLWRWGGGLSSAELHCFVDPLPDFGAVKVSTGVSA